MVPTCSRADFLSRLRLNPGPTARQPGSVPSVKWKCCVSSMGRPTAEDWAWGLPDTPYLSPREQEELPSSLPGVPTPQGPISRPEGPGSHSTGFTKVHQSNAAQASERGLKGCFETPP